MFGPEGGPGEGDAVHWASSARETAVAGSRDTYIVQLVVEPTGIADRVPVGIPPPERGSGGLTVCTGRSCPSCCRLGSGERGGGEIKTNVKFQNYRDRLKKIIIEIKTSKWPT